MGARVGILQIIYTCVFYAGNQTLDSKAATTGKWLWPNARGSNPAGIDAQASKKLTTISPRYRKFLQTIDFSLIF